MKLFTMKVRHTETALIFQNRNSYDIYRCFVFRRLFCSRHFFLFLICSKCACFVTFIQAIVSKELFSAAQQGLISLIKTNIGTLLEVTDSIWIIVKQNLNVLVTIFGSFFSLLLGGGNAVITFLINSVRQKDMFWNISFKLLINAFLCHFSSFRSSF